MHMAIVSKRTMPSELVKDLNSSVSSTIYKLPPKLRGR